MASRPGPSCSWRSCPVLVAIRIWLLRRRRARRSATPASSLIREAAAALVLDPPPPAVRPVRARAREPRRGDGAAGPDRQRAGRPDDRDPRDGRLAQHVRDRHPAQPTASPPRRRPPRSSSGRDRARQIGIVAFAGFAEIVQAPTTDQEVLLDVVESLTTGRRTAIGSAILESLDAIAEIDDSVAPMPAGGSEPGNRPGPVPRGRLRARDHRPADRWRQQRRAPCPSRPPPRPPPAGVRVYTIGFGTADPDAERPPCGAPVRRSRARRRARLRRDGGGGGGGGGFRRAIDEETLKAVADATGGTYYPAESADELHTVFENLPTNLITKHEVMEISVALRGPRGGARRAGRPARPGLAAAAIGVRPGEPRSAPCRFASSPFVV